MNQGVESPTPVTSHTVQLLNHSGKQNLLAVDKFVYLGGTVCSDASCDKDIARRIGIAAGVARNLERIWKAKDISKLAECVYHYVREAARPEAQDKVLATSS